MRHYSESAVVDYLRSLDIKHMEFFDEIYDHILSSYQNRVNLEQSVKEHIDSVVQPSIGGANGIKRIMRSQQKFRQKSINKRIGELFRTYFFGWPSMLTILTIASSIIFANYIFPPKQVFLVSIVISIFIPALIVGWKQIQFYWVCRKLELPYRTSDLNLRIFQFSQFGITGFNAFIYFLGIMIWGSPGASIEMAVQYPIINISLSVLFVLYGFICLKIFQEKFIIKLTHGTD